MNVDLALAKARTSQYAPATESDRLPPHSIGAEQGILGCVLYSQEVAIGCMAQCIEQLNSGADAFYDLRHQTIYTALVEMYDQREAIDLITLQQRLKNKNLLEQIGGIPYLNTLQDCVPSAANLPAYLELVAEKFLMRSWVAGCTSVVSKIYNHSVEVNILVDEIEADVTRLFNSRHSSGRKLLSIKAAVNAATDSFEASMSRGGITGLSWGFHDLDKQTCGMEGGEMIVIAARPSVGKTALAMNVVEHLAVVSGVACGVFSLEMSTEQLVKRLLCSVARVDGREIRQGNITPADFEKLIPAASKVSKSPIYIDDTPSLTITQLRAKAKRMQQLHGIKLLVVDYMQLLTAPKKGDGSREQEVTRISSGLKNLAKELNIPVIVLSQLNRDLEKGGGNKVVARRPRMSDLRESGSIEQDADFVGLLYRPDEECAVNLDIAKQRNGPRDITVHLTYLPQYTRFESMARIVNDDVPNNQHNDL